MDGIRLAHDRAGTCKRDNEYSGFIKCGKFLE